MGRALLAKLSEWTRRYLPLEIAATVTALAGALAVASFTDNAVAIAYGGAWAENIGYYAVAFVRELRTLAATADGAGPPASRLQLSAEVGRRLAWEFGLAEVLDSFVTRPGLMFAATAMIGSLEAGIVAGKVLADVLFYGIAIVFYELGKRHTK